MAEDKYDQVHLYLTWGGTAPGGETWQCGARYSEKNPGIGLEATYFLWSIDDVAQAVNDWWAGTTILAPPDYRLVFVKVALIGKDGLYKHEVREKLYVPPVAPGTSTAQPLQPLQAALVVSLRSGDKLGVANFGRFYIPPPAQGRILNQGTIPTSVANNVRDKTKTMLKAIEGEFSTVEQAAELAIFHKTSVKSPVPSHKPVKAIWVGDVLDTQRRRRRAVPETYVKVDY